MRYVGVCFDSGAWGGDLTGLLVVEEPNGWKVAASHISSSVDWAQRDIGVHFDRLREPADTYEWVDLMTVAQVEERFGWRQAPVAMTPQRAKETA
jgi:hypothetical protein